MVTRIGPSRPHRVYLQEWREKIGLTQERLAERLGTTKTTISRWEAWGAGERRPRKCREPNIGALQAFADGLGVSAGDLFHDPVEGGSLWTLIKSLPPHRQREVAEIIQVIQRAA